MGPVGHCMSPAQRMSWCCPAPGGQAAGPREPVRHRRQDAAAGQRGHGGHRHAGRAVRGAGHRRRRRGPRARRGRPALAGGARPGQPGMQPSSGCPGPGHSHELAPSTSSMACWSRVHPSNPLAASYACCVCHTENIQHSFAGMPAGHAENATRQPSAQRGASCCWF